MQGEQGTHPLETALSELQLPSASMKRLQNFMTHCKAKLTCSGALWRRQLAPGVSQYPTAGVSVLCALYWAPAGHGNEACRTCTTLAAICRLDAMYNTPLYIYK